MGPMRITTDTWTLEIPDGWSLVMNHDHDCARLMYGADVDNTDAQSGVGATGSDILLRVLRLPASVSLTSFAETTMKRHVRQGEPERYSRVIGGRSAHAYSWTDGVANINTYFVEATLGIAVRIDIATAGIGPAAETAREAQRSA